MFVNIRLQTNGSRKILLSIHRITQLTITSVYVSQYSQRTMSFYHKISRSNIANHKFACYSYAVFCLFFICYFIIYARYNQIPYTGFTTSDEKHNSNEKSSNWSKPPMKYILLWTSPKKVPFVYFGEGNTVFVNKSCKWTNCYVTSDRYFLGAYSEFEVVVFNGPQLPLMIYTRDWPKERHVHQKYVFANIESAANYPVRSNVFNGFFNWTWTYKLNSDAVWGYFVIRDADDKVIGPKNNISWMMPWHMDPIDRDFFVKLKSKSRAAAWMCTNQDSASHREEFVEKLQQRLKKHSLRVDIFGECGDQMCPKEIMSRCLKMIKKRYYFYLAFENSFSDDYVTEKVLYALNHDTVPIVYGGADYSRFLPPGSYLDAFKLGPKKLAEIMAQVIADPFEYSKFFMWKNHYTYHETHQSPDTDSYCKFCEVVNNETLMSDRKNYDHFNVWWMENTKKIL